VSKMQSLNEGKEWCVKESEQQSMSSFVYLVKSLVLLYNNHLCDSTLICAFCSG